jgi:hypothetical protein
MIQLLFLLFTLSLWIAQPAYAVDATDSVTEISQSGHWQVTEFAGAKQLIYRLSTSSINTKREHIVFDFVPSKNCLPTPAVMIVNLDSYNEVFNAGLLPVAYKLPSQKQATELVKTDMSEGDTFAFFSFKKFTVKTLLQSGDRGKVAVWIPASGDGTVKKSGNMYFSLDGFSLAYKEAKRLCGDNK